MKKLTFIFIMILSFIFLQWGISNASIVALRTSPDNTRAVFNHLSKVELFGLMIYGESLKKSSFEGRQAIGSVALERNDYYKWGIKKVLLQPKWFSCFNPDDKGFQQLKTVALHYNYFLKKVPALQESKVIAEFLLNGFLPRHKVIANYSIKHFVALNVENKWTKKMAVVIAHLDGHKFLAEKNEIKGGYANNEKSKFKGIELSYTEPIEVADPVTLRSSSIKKILSNGVDTRKKILLV